jgi:hypothetical protein
MNDLIQAVLEQIQDDVANGDLTAIAELLDNVPVKLLKGYLSEIVEK